MRAATDRIELHQFGSNLAFDKHNTALSDTCTTPSTFYRLFVERSQSASIVCRNLDPKERRTPLELSLYSDENEAYAFTSAPEQMNTTSNQMATRWSLLVGHDENELTDILSGSMDFPLFCRLMSAQLPSQSMLVEPLYSEPIERELDRLFKESVTERFEVGIESKFARALGNLLAVNPDKVLSSLEERVLSSECDSEVIAETMRWAGELELEHVRDTVVALLCTGLQHASSLVRDAAALSLGNLEGPSAIGYLERAIEHETVPELRADIRGLVMSLQR